MKIPFLSRKADPLAIPAYKDTPAGKRVGLITVAGVAWELIDHAPVPNLTLRHLDDRDAVHATFILSHTDVQTWVFKTDELLGKKKLQALAEGFHLDGWEPGTYVLAQDPENKADYYGGKIADLLAFFEKQLTATMESPQPDPHAADTNPTDGPGDGG